MPTPEINYRAATGSIIRNNWVETRIGTITAIASHFERFKEDYNLLKAMYVRSMIDIEALMDNHSSENEGFNEMSRLNTYMLSYSIYYIVIIYIIRYSSICTICI